MNQEDHDLIIEINADVKHIKKWTESHQKQDDERHVEQQKQNKSYNRIIWLGGGILLAFEILFKFFQ